MDASVIIYPALWDCCALLSQRFPVNVVHAIDANGGSPGPTPGSPVPNTATHLP